MDRPNGVVVAAALWHSGHSVPVTVAFRKWSRMISVSTKHPASFAPDSTGWPSGTPCPSLPTHPARSRYPAQYRHHPSDAETLVCSFR
uniref:Putative secreted protein n=1 Tax=Anopheles darlingi TaxID=43151 RepID=A0A2M4DD73_ANODA